MIVYRRLWFYMAYRYNMSRTRLLEVISPPTLAKLGKNKNVDIKTIDKICNFLKCQPEDIMEHIPDVKGS